MKTEKSCYSAAELQVFDTLLIKKLEAARKELNFIQDSLARRAESDESNLPANLHAVEDGMEREKLSQLAARQKRFITQLEGARMRIKSGTYGICVETGAVIDKERLFAVPHTTHSIEAKIERDK